MGTGHRADHKLLPDAVPFPVIQDDQAAAGVGREGQVSALPRSSPLCALSAPAALCFGCAHARPRTIGHRYRARGSGAGRH